GTPIQIVHGTRKVAGNVIWLGELHPYTVRHTSEGGKGGSSSVTTTETRYKRSFLISICHGEANIRRVWANNEEISIEDLTAFSGLDNGTDIPAVTEEAYGTYRYIACAFFEEYELGNSASLPNFTFEMVTGEVIFAASHFAIDGVHYVLDINYELIERIVGSSGGDATDVSISGNYIVSQGWNVVAGRLPIAIYDSDNNDLGITFDWGAITGSGKTTGALFSLDGNYVYVALGNTGAGAANYIVKWKISDGSQEWLHTATGYTLLFLDIDRYENIYFRNATGIGVRSGHLDGSDGTLNEYYINDAPPAGISATYNAYIYNNFVYFLGHEYFTPFNNVWKCPIPTEQGGVTGSAAVAAMPLVYEIPPANPQYLNIIVNENGVYIIYNKTLYKLNHDLTDIEEQITIITNLGGNFTSIHFDSGDNIITKVGKGEWATDYSIIIYDKDLVRLEGYDTSGSTFRIDIGFRGNESIKIPAIILTDTIDVNPANVILDLLTNTVYGAKIDSSTYIDSASFAVAAAHCSDKNILCSFVFNNRKPVMDHIDYVLSHFQGYLFMSEGKINIGVYKEESSIFDIDQDNLVVDDAENPEPPIKVSKRKYSETNNRVEITWTNREAEYDTSVAIANDEVDQRISGTVRIKTINLLGITNADLAQMMAYRYLSESMYRFSTYNFVLSDLFSQKQMGSKQIKRAL
ncbi:hypothetical protein LCGC14_2080530, partial [marine sediment metagenome]